MIKSMYAYMRVYLVSVIVRLQLYLVICIFGKISSYYMCIYTGIRSC